MDDGLVLSKVCSQCGIEQERSKFPKQHGRVCQSCRNIRQQERRSLTGDSDTKKYEKSFKGYLMRTYRNMLSRVSGVQKQKAHLYEGLEILDKETFYAWSLENEDYKTLFANWVDSDYDVKVGPSIDRIETDKGYVMGNIRWITQSLNSQLGALSRHSK